MDDSADLPLVQQWTGTLDVEQLLPRVRHLPHCILLDSALQRPHIARYSFLSADPFAVLSAPADGRDALGDLARALPQWRSATRADLPPFQGGAAGLFSYDLHRSLERIQPPQYDEFQVPAMMVGLYDVVLAIDHQQNEAWLISQGFPETDLSARRSRAQQRLNQFRSWLEAAPTAHTASPATTSGSANLPADLLAPQYPTGQPNVTSNFTAAQYLDAVQQTIDYICAGDVFQVNLAQRLLHPAIDDPVQLYLRLRSRNPATFAGYYDLGQFQILSASPERFLQVRHGRVEARPIKGTRQRLPHAVASLYAADDLLGSEKDRAENVMIVDLLRNDLSIVCHPDSVQVTQLCQIETYQYVQHLVSAVCGQLRPSATALDLMRAAFPGGSITGAPKVRAMEIISQLENVARGPYCGSMGYIGFDGAMDMSILIRTITAGRGWWQMPVGGGITAQSDPQKEYEETWHKALGMVRAIAR